MPEDYKQAFFTFNRLTQKDEDFQVREDIITKEGEYFSNNQRENESNYFENIILHYKLKIYSSGINIEGFGYYRSININLFFIEELFSNIFNSIIGKYS